MRYCYYSIFGNHYYLLLLNVPFYIARKIQKDRDSKGSIIGPVIFAATLAIALGMILMIVAVATGLGLKKAISDKIIGFTGHITVTRYEINSSYEQQAIDLDSLTSAAIKSIDGVEQIQAFGTKAGILTGKEDFEGIVLKGVTKNYNAYFFTQNLRQGKLPIFSDSVRNDSVVISQNLANRLQLALYDTVRMYFIQEPPRPPKIRKFFISGIYATGLEEFDKTYIIGDIKHVQRLNGWKNTEVGGYEIFLASTKNVEDKTQQLRSFLPYDVDARSMRSENEQLFQWLDLFDLNIYLILSIMVIVAIINMVSALLILILDRTHMIGLLKALGLSNLRLMYIFLYQSIQIIVRGLIWGNAIGIGICLLQQEAGIFKLDPETYYVSEAPVLIDIPVLLALNAGILLICLVTLLIPALLVGRISPVKALRYE
jgi:lipoprotein-releasing system permease protein